MGTPMTDAHKVEHSLGVLFLCAVEYFILIVTNGIVAGTNVYYEVLSVVFALDQVADVVLVDLATATCYLIFSRHSLVHVDLHSTRVNLCCTLKSNHEPAESVRKICPVQ